jgi:hypothetical protein
LEGEPLKADWYYCSFVYTWGGKGVGPRIQVCISRKRGGNFSFFSSTSAGEKRCKGVVEQPAPETAGGNAGWHAKLFCSWRWEKSASRWCGIGARCAGFLFRQQWVFFLGNQDFTG